MSSEILVEMYADDLRPAERALMSEALRREMLGIREVDSVAAAEAGPALPSTKSAGLAAVGGLVVSVQPTVELLGKVLQVAKAWLDRRRSDAVAPKAMRVTINGQSLDFYPNEQQATDVLAIFLAEAVAAGARRAPGTTRDAAEDD
jgi:hypothetical protein